LPRSSAVRFSHFLPSLLLLLAGLAAAYVKDLNVFFTSLFNVLPTLVLLLGGAYCAVYRRQRELFLMVTVYIAYFLLDTQTDTTATTARCVKTQRWSFILCCLLLPLLFGVFAAWQERTHLFQDMVARFAVLLAVGSVALGLEQSYPQALLIWLSEIRWPALARRLDEPDPAVLSGVHRFVPAADLPVLAQPATAARRAVGGFARVVLDACRKPSSCRSP
jgi:hypothetical protein